MARALWRAIAKVKQRWSVIGWVTKNLLSRVLSCFGRYVKPLVLLAFAIVSTHQTVLGPLWVRPGLHQSGHETSEAERTNRL
jgi:hypothetical protein